MLAQAVWVGVKRCRFDAILRSCASDSQGNFTAVGYEDRPQWLLARGIAGGCCGVPSPASSRAESGGGAQPGCCAHVVQSLRHMSRQTGPDETRYVPVVLPDNA